MYLGKVTRAFSDQINIFEAPREKVRGGKAESPPKPNQGLNTFRQKLEKINRKRIHYEYLAQVNYSRLILCEKKLTLLNLMYTIISLI